MDGIHSSVGVLVYDKLPLVHGGLHTSAFVPPLLAGARFRSRRSCLSSRQPRPDSLLLPFRLLAHRLHFVALLFLRSVLPGPGRPVPRGRRLVLGGERRSH